MPTWTLTSDLFVAGDLTISSGSFDTDGFNVTVSGNLVWSSPDTFYSRTGTFDIAGDVTLSSGTINQNASNWFIGGNVTVTPSVYNYGSGTITLNGSSGTQNIDFNGYSVPALVINAAGATKIFTNDITANSFSHKAGAINFNAQTFETLGDFEISQGATVTLPLLGGTNIVVGGNLTWLGAHSPLLSINPTTSWTISVTGTGRIGYADVRNLDASGGSEIVVWNGVDLGGNTNLVFSDTIATGGMVFDGIMDVQVNTSYRSTGGASFSNDLDPTIISFRPRFTQAFQWDVAGTVSVSLSFRWNVGTNVLKWYRIEGKCEVQNCANSGFDPYNQAGGNTGGTGSSVSEEGEVIPAPPQPQPYNIIQNGGFELWEGVTGPPSEPGSLPTHWYRQPTAPNGVTNGYGIAGWHYFMSINVVDEGSSALRLQGTGSKPFGPPPFNLPQASVDLYVDIDDLSDIQSGELYTLKFSVNSDLLVTNTYSSAAFLSIRLYQIGFSPIDHYTIADFYWTSHQKHAQYVGEPLLPNEWTEYTQNLKFQDITKIESLRVQISLGGMYGDDGTGLGSVANPVPNGKGVWLDGFQIISSVPQDNSYEPAPGVEVTDPFCKTKFFTTVAATSLADLCNKLKNPTMNAPVTSTITSIKRYTRTVYRDQNTGTSTCNILIPETFNQVPECIDFAVDENLEVSIGGFMEVTDAFFNFTASGGISLSGGTAATKVSSPPTIGSGGISFGGSADVVSPVYVYVTSGGIDLDGEAIVVADSYYYEATGGWSLSGEAGPIAYSPRSYTASGGMGFSGSVSSFPGFSHTPSFPFVFFGGTSDAAIVRYHYTASGGIGMGGDSPESADAYQYSGTGGITTGGEAIVSGNPYFPNGGVTFGGNANTIGISYGQAGFGGSAGIKLTIRNTSTGGAIFGGEAICVSPNYSYEASGGMGFGGDAFERSNYLGELEASGGGFIETSDFGVVFSDIPGDELTITSGSVTTSCGCNPMPLILRISHNFNDCNYLNTFLQRNRLTLPSDFTLSYVNDAWQQHFHFTGLSDDNVTREKWDMLFQWSCTSQIGGEDLGNFVWEFYTIIRRKNLTTGTDFDTKLIWAIQSEEACINRGSVLDTQNTVLDVVFTADMSTNIVSTSNNAPVIPQLVFDGIGLFKGQFWAKNPKLIIQVTQLQPSQFPERMDISSIFPPEPILLPQG